MPDMLATLRIQILPIPLKVPPLVINLYLLYREPLTKWRVSVVEWNHSRSSDNRSSRESDAFVG